MAESTIVCTNEILFFSTYCLVADSTSKVSYDETLRVEEISMIVEFGFSRHRESEVSPVLVVDSLCEVSVGRLRKSTLLVQEVNDTTRTELNKI